MLIIKNLKVNVNGKPILKGIDFTVKMGEIHVLMGPNGAGKTTLAMSLIGYNTIENSMFEINGEDMNRLSVEERARKGLFVSFQNPPELEGVSFFSFLRTASKSLYPKKKNTISEFKKEVLKVLEKVGLSEDFLNREVNENFSAGEKKRAEIVQLLVLKPKFAILDEIDSGLDVDSLKIILSLIKEAAEENQMGIILITHNPKITDYLKPTFVRILIDGEIKKTGGLELVKKIEMEGYAEI